MSFSGQDHSKSCREPVFCIHVSVYRLMQQDLAGASWHFGTWLRFRINSIKLTPASFEMRDFYGFVCGSNRHLGFMHANPFSASHRLCFQWPSAGHIFGSWRSRWNWVLASDGWLGRTPGAVPLVKQYFGRKHDMQTLDEWRRHLRGVLLRWTRMFLMRLENGWYRILSFEGCNNEVRFGLDCLIIGVRHWCKTISFIVILFQLVCLIQYRRDWHGKVTPSLLYDQFLLFLITCKHRCRMLYIFIIFHCCNIFIIFLRLWVS